MALVYLVQHGDKEHGPGDPGLTEAGRERASRTALWLRAAGLRAVYSSPLRRAIQTAEFIAAASALDIRPDARLRERMNWDGSQSLADFLAAWDRSVLDRDFIPAGGDSSRGAAERLRAFLADRSAGPGPVAATTHGGVTADLLRTLLGDDQVPAGLLQPGIPSCAITTVDFPDVVDIASVAHLS
jgi:broad specificity phosphatase PhoE